MQDIFCIIVLLSINIKKICSKFIVISLVDYFFCREVFLVLQCLIIGIGPRLLLLFF